MPDWALEPGIVPTERLDELVRVVSAGGVLVLSGAGLSTDSGIPDYRGASGTLRRGNPMSYEEFLHSAAGRRRYWARSHIGWRTIARARPNTGHAVVAELGAAGLVDGVITQNVDGLHQSAGSGRVVELHGGLDRVICLHCGARSSRERLDARFRAVNPDFDRAVAVTMADTGSNPDGDVELPDSLVRAFSTVHCADCGSGPLKPDVVFFGESVPRERVRACERMVDEASSLLVLGSSLAVMSGLRFVRRAEAAGIPVLIVNQGVTRGDRHALVRVGRPLGTALTELRSELLGAD